MILRVEHIGIAVKDMKGANTLFEALLGISNYKVESVESENVATSFFKTGETKIELLESTSDSGPIAKFIEKKGQGIHHIAFAVESVQEFLDHAASKEVALIDKAPRAGAEGLQIGFLHPKSTNGVLTEVCENPKK